MRKLSLILVLLLAALSAGAYSQLDRTVVHEEGKAVAKIPMRPNGEIKN